MSAVRVLGARLDVPSGVASGPRMCLMINIEQSLLRDVGVDLGCRQITVAEQLLDAAEIGTAIQQVGGEAVPQRVRAGRVNQARTQQVSLQQSTDAARCQPGASLVQEQSGFLRAASGCRSGIQRLSQCSGHRADRTEPLAPSLASDPDQLLVEVEVVEVQSHQFADSQPAAVQRFQHRPITHARRRIGRHRVEQANHLVDAEQPRQPSRLLGITKPSRRVCCRPIPCRRRYRKNDRRLASRRATVLAA